MGTPGFHKGELTGTAVLPVLASQSMQTNVPPGPLFPITLRVQPGRDGAFDVCDQDGTLLGTSQNEMMAVWTAVAAAEEISRRGMEAKVVTTRGGVDFVEFVANPPQRPA